MGNPRSRHLLLILITAIALIAGDCAYSRHDLGSVQHDSGRCDLCSHFAGSAGSPSDISTTVGKPVLALRALPAGNDVILPSRPSAGISLPRGPPRSLELT